MKYLNQQPQKSNGKYQNYIEEVIAFDREKVKNYLNASKNQLFQLHEEKEARAKHIFLSLKDVEGLNRAMRKIFQQKERQKRRTNISQLPVSKDSSSKNTISFGNKPISIGSEEKEKTIQNYLKFKQSQNNDKSFLSPIAKKQQNQDEPHYSSSSNSNKRTDSYSQHVMQNQKSNSPGQSQWFTKYMQNTNQQFYEQAEEGAAKKGAYVLNNPKFQKLYESLNYQRSLIRMIKLQRLGYDIKKIQTDESLMHIDAKPQSKFEKCALRLTDQYMTNPTKQEPLPVKKEPYFNSNKLYYQYKKGDVQLFEKQKLKEYNGIDEYAYKMFNQDAPKIVKYLYMPKFGDQIIANNQIQIQQQFNNSARRYRSASPNQTRIQDNDFFIQDTINWAIKQNSPTNLQKRIQSPAQLRDPNNAKIRKIIKTLPLTQKQHEMAIYEEEKIKLEKQKYMFE